MTTRTVLLLSGSCAALAAPAAAQDRPPLQRLDNAIYVEPLRVAECRWERGQVVRTTDWLDYQPSGSRFGPTDSRVFDCFGDDDSDGYMDDSGECGMGASRWMFGTAYCNGLATNDMRGLQAHNCAGFGRADFAWYWTCGGSGTEDCLVAIWTQESNPNNCEADSFEYSGWVLDFGPLTCNPGAFFYANADISAIGAWPTVAEGDGSYALAFLTDSGSRPATCAQPMLWGSPNNSGGGRGPGAQETRQLDDIEPSDGFHAMPTECLTYSFGVCPDPLGAMLQFWGDPVTECLTECACLECDRDGRIDTRDLLCFLALWSDDHCDADCNNDGTIDSLDVLCFLRLWAVCR